MSNDALLRMSIIDAALEIVRHRNRYPSVTLEETIKRLRNGSSHLASLNYNGAIELAELVGWDAFCLNKDRRCELRDTILCIGIRTKPLWAKFSTYGRNRVRQILNNDQEQCFRYADLFSTPADTVIIQWWDSLADNFRDESAKRNLSIGREGEILSLQYETERLRKAGINKEPIWMSIDDNSAGYDILSYDLDENNNIVDIRIEVKASTSKPPRFIVTTNEWNTSLENPSIYQFHVWQLQSKHLSILSCNDLRHHVPENKGIGKWLQTELTLNDSSLPTQISLLNIDDEI